MNILLTNDDGIWAPGLRALYQILFSAGHQLTVVAPLTEQSAVGHAVTLSSPLRIKKVNDGPFQGFGVSGSPVDCVKIALGTVYNLQPQLLISGINNGANVGVDILYSGTVAAATEAALVGIPALAVSVDHFNPEDLSPQAEYVRDFIHTIDWASLPPRRVLNMNFPDLPVPECKGLRLCPQTQAVYEDWYDERTDPRGRRYYWLCGEILPQNLEPDTDRTLLTQGFITLTPLTFDFTDHKLMHQLDASVAGGR